MANSNRLAKRYLSDLSASPEDLHNQSFEGLLRYLDANSPLHERLGYSISLKQDGYRLGQAPLLHFHGSAFTDVKQKNTTGLYKLSNAYWGLFGINGPLPSHFTEHAIQREYRYKDSTLVEFCDLFHHRFLSLFYRAWADAQPAISHDFAQSQNDIFAQRVNVFSGANTQTEPAHLDTYLAGLFSMKTRGASSLKQALQSYLGHRVEIQEFVGCWYDIPDSEFCTLGKANCVLGKNATIGQSSFQRSFNIAIHIGPLSFKHYTELLNDPLRFDTIRRLTSKLLGSEFTVAIHLQLAPSEKQQSRLGQSALGRTSWIASTEDSNSEVHIAHSQVL